MSSRLLFRHEAHIFTGFLALPCSTTIPPITGAQAEALDAARFLAEKHALGLRFLQGAIQTPSTT
ncbi:hypothetical protein BJ912DRAFT_847911 [Pholiota molesta]|nr:hypothetical protein BJ912DRAFT_847911 [Pholiota molesta]